jgi:hypothetical protein
MNALEIITGIVSIGKDVIKDEDIQKFVCGTYADGKTRNLRDAIDGEFLSPKQKKKATSKKSKKKHTKFKL